MRRSSWIAVLALAACTTGPAGTPYETLRSDGEPLQSAFNAAAGKVRAVFLVAPT